LEHGVKTITQKYVYVYYNTFKFLQILESYLEGEIQLADFMGSYQYLRLLQALEELNDISDFDGWYESVRKFAKVDKKTSDDGSNTTLCLF
jgi:hypothetical protein